MSRRPLWAGTQKAPTEKQMQRSDVSLPPFSLTVLLNVLQPIWKKLFVFVSFVGARSAVADVLASALLLLGQGRLGDTDRYVKMTTIEVFTALARVLKL